MAVFFGIYYFIFMRMFVMDVMIMQMNVGYTFMDVLVMMLFRYE